MASPLTDPVTNGLPRFGRPQINREPSKLLAITTPWLLVMFGSLSPTWPIVTSAPLLPPFGFLFLIAWQQLRPGLFPVWAGLPLGLFDDLYSGQPFGCAVLLWSATMITLDIFEARFPWRGVVFNWLVAGAILIFYLFAAAVIANFNTEYFKITLLLPQILLSILAYPLLAFVVSLADRFRLIPIRKR